MGLPAQVLMASDNWIQFFSREQQNALLEHLEAWWLNERSSEPADRSAAEGAVKLAYANLNLPAPVIAWCDSPLTMALSRAIVETLGSKDLENPERPKDPTAWDVGSSSFCGPFIKGRVRNELIVEAEDRIMQEVGMNAMLALLKVSTASGWRADSLSIDENLGLRRSLYDRKPTWSFVTMNDGRAGVPAARVIHALEIAIQSDFRRRTVSKENIAKAMDISEQILGRTLADAEVEQIIQYYQLRNIGGFVNLLQRTVVESCFGQFDSRFLVLPSFFREVNQFDWHTERLVPLITLAKTTGGYLPHEKVCWLFDKANAIHFDDNGRLHNEAGAAVEYGDWGAYAWQGVVVDKRTIVEPQTLTVKEIESEANLETRRIMITRYGDSKFLEDSGATVVDDDPAFGTLFRKDLARDEPLLMVKVKNSTPEPDGSFRYYLLRVPPRTRTAKDAVAWTFGMTGQQYNPEKET